MNEKCMRCGCELRPIDIAATKKFINRGATEFMCKPCLAKEFKISEGLLNEKIAYFKSYGCMLFQGMEVE